MIGVRSTSDKLKKKAGNLKGMTFPFCRQNYIMEIDQRPKKAVSISLRVSSRGMIQTQNEEKWRRVKLLN